MTDGLNTNLLTDGLSTNLLTDGLSTNLVTDGLSTNLVTDGLGTNLVTAAVVCGQRSWRSRTLAGRTADNTDRFHRTVQVYHSKHIL